MFRKALFSERGKNYPDFSPLLQSFVTGRQYYIVDKGKTMDGIFAKMLAMARAGIAPRDRGEFCSVGYVSAVLEGANGRLYRGVNIDLACGLGFCAERSAAAAMLTDGEHVVRRVVCVNREGALMSPCGACREFLSLLAPENAETEFLVGEEPVRTVKLCELLPMDWQRPPLPAEERR